jgi:hypothetical protein
VDKLKNMSDEDDGEIGVNVYDEDELIEDHHLPAEENYDGVHILLCLILR